MCSSDPYFFVGAESFESKENDTEPYRVRQDPLPLLGDWDLGTAFPVEDARGQTGRKHTQGLCPSVCGTLALGAVATLREE